jgi:hypothetical protein
MYEKVLFCGAVRGVCGGGIKGPQITQINADFTNHDERNLRNQCNQWTIVNCQLTRSFV